MFGSKDLLFSSETYGVAKSLRFRSSASAYLRLANGTPTSAQKWTWSAWVKRGTLGTQVNISGAGQTSGTNYTNIAFRSDNALQFNDTTTTDQAFLITTQVFRDPSAWYHIVLAVDTTSATTTITGGVTDRIRLYVNGSQVSSFTGGTVVPAQNYNTLYNSSGYTKALGNIWYNNAPGGFYFDGYLAEVNFIDGQPLTPSSFGFYDNNGIWQPKGYTGTYGTNGFYLKFTDVGATSGANTGYGKDFSGFNTNYWTTNNFGTTSTATTYDSMYDSPVNASNGITGIGNYAVLNPLLTNGTAPTNANLTSSATDAANQSSFPMQTGKWYAEATLTTLGSQDVTVGITSTISVVAPSSQATGYGWGAVLGRKWVNGSVTTGFATAVAGDIAGLAFNADTGQLDVYKNNVLVFSITGIPSAIYNFVNGAGGTSGSNTINWNFGQRPFAYTPPSGYLALNTQNLTTPTISNGASYMAAVTYTGSASTQSVTATSTNSGNNPNAVTFQPDLVWIKDRTNAQSHKLTDAVRGTTKAISTDSTAAEATDANGVTAFNNNGFSLGTGTRAYSDSNLDSYVAWEWKEGVSQGFDIVSYAGDNTSNRNISHNLGVAPAFVWVKSLSTGSFYIYHQNLTGSTYFLKCNSTDGANAQTNTNTPWGTANWSSTQFMVTNNATNNLNASSTNYIGYLWAAIAGYSAFGSYTGNGSSDGPFVYTGFRPRFVLMKVSSGSTGSWYIFDTSRATYNVIGLGLAPDSSVAEFGATATNIDALSNGFKLRTISAELNASTYTYIYAAFAENPFKISRAR